MDIFKFFFEHDLRLEQLSSDYDARQELKKPSSLEDFMKPVQTYSKFYITGTLFPQLHFGINSLESFDKIVSGLVLATERHFLLHHGNQESTIASAIMNANPGDTFILSKKALNKADYKESLLFDRELSVREKIPYLKTVLDDGHLVVFVEKAHHGFDLHIFSKDNIYESFFNTFKPMITPTFRFFSINGKRAKSERLFYFETWTLDRPPHGFEEVFPETVLR